MGQKACENLPCVGMKLFVKFEINAFGNMGVMPGHTHTHTDGQAHSYHIYYDKLCAMISSIELYLFIPFSLNLDLFLW